MVGNIKHFQNYRTGIPRCKHCNSLKYENNFGWWLCGTCMYDAVMGYYKKGRLVMVA
jgi:Tfp pilus assembly protein PilF